ncbi:MAG: N-6 DNA methylase [Allomuricauda sp.]|jgi:adenine-specific DNA-methyltransferase
MESTLSQIFTSDYNRTSFEDNVLKPIFLNSVKDFILYDPDGEQEIELTDTDKRTAKKVVKYGEFKTHDNRKIELYEVTVEDFRQVKIARVGLGALVKKLIIGNNAVFAIFKYENVKGKRWRFSFVAYDSFFLEGQVQTKETNPKRYTYVFGDKEETYRTAIDRFQELDSKFQIKVKDIQDAFAVEAMSKEFFDEYRETHYAKFIKYLTGEEFQKKGSKYELVPVQNPSPFLASVFNGDKKDARNFCKKLLGQIVFLYFIQKKGWLGATNTNYKEGNGDKNFIQNFYKQAGENDNFYPLWLSKLFYYTLNKKRDDDDFKMPDGTIVKIPYLNGGLFEKESDKFDHLVFPSELFTDLFEFFNRFNFTIYENSPEEHTVAVDPEMLGHIFENLLEDNKDKGAFYTPKEIVQYMTQESLIEYLVTHIGENTKIGISQFVKQKDKEALTNKQLNEINHLLDKVKICDPAIGSGAFPMGLLHEIFALKERIAFDLGFKVWSPATVKENIIQNSIYGVDIEKGAVDIAQLRFWLSLIVDEEEPKPLPNLAYKIVVGNSLVSKFGNEIIEIDWEVDEGTQSNLFGNPYQEDIQDLLEQISAKQKEYFTANNNNKPRLTKEIRLLKLEILSKQLELMINTKGFEKVGNKRLSKPQNERWLETEGWKRTLQQVNTLKTNNKPFNHFDWRLDFPEILNPIVNENTGFDIVIGNPPYLKERDNAHIFKPINDSPFGKKWHQGKMDFWFYFLHKSIDITKKEGKISFITSRYWLNSQGASKIIQRVKDELSFLNVVDIGKLKVFNNVAGHHMIHIYNKGKNDKFLYKSLSEDVKHIIYDVKTEFISFKELKNENVFRNKNIIFSEPLISDSIETFPLGNFYETSIGVQESVDRISNKQFKNNPIDSAYPGKGVFVLTQNELESLNLNDDEMKLIKPYLDPADVIKYGIKEEGKKYLIYSDKVAREQIKSNNNYLNLKNHLDFHSIYITSSNKPYGIHRARQEKFFERPKIIFKGMFVEPEFTIDDNKFYFGFSFSSIIQNSTNKSLKYLLAILNSKLAKKWFVTNGKHRGAGVDVGVEKLRTFPIVFNKNEKYFESIVDYIMTLKKGNKQDLNHKLMISYFEQIIDGMVYELYFPDLLEEHNRTIIKHLGELPELTDSMTDNEKETVINTVFERLDDKGHPVRNNLFYMRNIDEIKTIEELKQ